MERIKPADFQVLHQKEDITILDVREVDEFQAGHIEGALNAPLSTLENGYEQLDSSKRYYVICQGGMRSERACQFLETKGFDVVNIEGGMNQWKAQSKQSKFNYRLLIKTFWKRFGRVVFQQTIQRGRSLTHRILMTIASLMMRKVLEKARLRTF